MRILLAGATGVLGRATLPHLDGHHVVGLTRTREKLRLLEALGVDGVVCDAYDAEALLRVARQARPELIVNFLTDLSSGPGEANNRVRREAGTNLVTAAVATGSRRLVVESVAFPLERAAAEAVDLMEKTAREAPLEVLILRFGRLWGPGTWYREPPDPPAIEIDDAGARAASLIISGPAGVHVIAET
ncbi:MAG TPA: NAD(P)H-binding protein [Gaiellaceae bacterium]|nr:NAD(P)H-binding protein [Gaiellaceae bacterium]